MKINFSLNKSKFNLEQVMAILNITRSKNGSTVTYQIISTLLACMEWMV